MRLLLVDAASMYFRAYYGNKSGSTAPDGVRSNAISGLFDALSTVVQAYAPDALVACWDDDWRPQWRVDLIGSYKAHRVGDDGGEGEVPDELSPQVPRIAELFEVMGIPAVGAPGCEADDVIGTLATLWVDEGRGPVDVLTGDRDLFQLVDDDAGVRVLYPARGVREMLQVTESVLAEKYGVPDGPAYEALAILRGDSSDGLPGVRGIGEKTGQALLERYGTLQAIRDAAVSGMASTVMTARRARAVLEASDYLDAAAQVVRVLRDAPVTLGQVSALSVVAGHADAARELGERYGAARAVSRFVNTVAQ